MRHQIVFLCHQTAPIANLKRADAIFKRKEEQTTAFCESDAFLKESGPLWNKLAAQRGTFMTDPDPDPDPVEQANVAAAVVVVVVVVVYKNT